MKDLPLASRTSCNGPPHGSAGWFTGGWVYGVAVGWEKRMILVGEVLGGWQLRCGGQPIHDFLGCGFAPSPVR